MSTARPSTAAGREGIPSTRCPATLVDQEGTGVGLDLFRGHPVLISMFYASCGDSCPLLIAEIQRIEAELPPPVRADLRVALVSLDPDRDTPEVLQAYARAHHVDKSRWRFLRAPDDTVREIAAVLGLKYRRLSDGNFNHSSLITLLDASGSILTRVEGIGSRIGSYWSACEPRGPHRGTEARPAAVIVAGWHTSSR